MAIGKLARPSIGIDAGGTPLESMTMTIASHSKAAPDATKVKQVKSPETSMTSMNSTLH